MARDVPRGLAHHIRDLTGLWRADPRADGELLSAFATGDEGAFAALVVRHGKPVWATCLRVLGNEADAEDAFQATFIALARKATQVRAESVAGWLQKVSREVALNARKAAQRRDAAQSRLHERAVPQADETPDEELRAAVADEMSRLPERLRVPLTLYYVEGKTQAEVGRILGVTDRAAAHRLKQGVKLLRDRLARRGVAVAASVLAAVLGNVPVAVAVPKGLVAHTTEMALAIAAGAPAQTTAAQLALSVTQTTVWTRLKLCGLLLIPALSTIVGAVFLSQHPSQAAPESPASRLIDAATEGARTDRFGDPLPPGALSRLGTLRFRIGNPGGISNVAFGPGGKLLISAHATDSVHFWEPETGREVRKIDAPSSCWSVSASRDGKQLVGVGIKEVWAWDLSGTEPKVLWKVPSKSPGPSTVEFSPDGKLVACGGDSGREIRLLDAITGATAQTLIGRGCRFAFTADSKRLASWTWSPMAEVSVWDLVTGTRQHTLTAGVDKEIVSSVAFSADGKTLVTAGQDRRLRVWDVEKGTETRKLAEDAAPHAFVNFAPDGRTLIEVGNGQIRFWNPETGRAAKPTVKTSESAWSTAYRLSPDGTRAATAWPFGVGLWDIATGRELGAVAGMPDGFVHPVVFSRDGSTLATAAYSEAVGSTVHLWDTADGRLRRQFSLAQRQMVWGIDLNSDGTLATSVGELVELPPKPPEKITRWDAVTGKSHADLRLPAETRSVALAPEGKFVAVAGPTGVALFDRGTGREVKKLSDQCKAESMAFSADGKTLAALEQGATRVTIWSLPDGRERHWPPPRNANHQQFRSPVALSADGRMLAVGGAEPQSNIRVIDLPNGTDLLPLDGRTFGWAFQEFAFAPDGRTLASAGSDGVVRVWEIVSARERYKFTGHRASVLGVAFSLDGRRLASSSMDSTVLVWDLTVPQQPAPVARATADQLWSALSGTDAAAAHRAIATLTAAPDTSVPFLKERLGTAPASAEQVQQWIADLGSDQFAMREAATKELAQHASRLEGELRSALANTTSAEARARLKNLVAGIGPSSPANRAAVRGIEALEQMKNDSAAKKLLQELAKLPADSATGREARSACRRLADPLPGR